MSPSSKESSSSESETKLATLGGGCFWCVEAVYQTVPGIETITSGYAGGRTPDPTYEEVCGGQTGHAEVVQIAFDPAVISYEKIIDLFWCAHDPTTKDRQGADCGSQYRSIILYRNEEERRVAERSKATAQAQFSKRIVTEIVPLKTFHPAEAAHQQFYQKHPTHPYSQAVTRPKVEKFLRTTGGG